MSYKVVRGHQVPPPSKEVTMDIAGFNLFSVEVIGAVVLLGVLIFAVVRGRKRNPGEASVETSERATKDLYSEEEARTRAGTDSAPE